MHYACCISPETIAARENVGWSKLSETAREKLKEKAQNLITKIVRYLSEKSDINQISNDHQTPLSLSLSHKNYEIAELLMNDPVLDVFKVCFKKK